MKINKKYMKPTTECVELDLQGVIAVSGEPKVLSTSEANASEVYSNDRSAWGNIWE